MEIQTRLCDRAERTTEQIEADSLNRAWCGYAPDVSDHEMREFNGGRWDPKEDRIIRETDAAFVHEGGTVAAYRIDGYEHVFDPCPNSFKIALIGAPFAPAGPTRLRLIDHSAVHRELSIGSMRR